MTDLVRDVLRHRISLSYEALSDGVTTDAILRRIIEQGSRPHQAAAVAR